MPDFEGHISIAASGQEVWDFVSQIANLPKYLPTVKKAEDIGGGRIRVRSEVENEAREQDGFFRVAVAGERLEWGSDGDKDYHGFMELTDNGHGETGVMVHLHLNPPPQDKAAIENRSDADFESKMQEGVEKCLQSIKGNVEGTGGKEEISESQ